MDTHASSPRKATKKASTRTRSTSSSKTTITHQREQSIPPEDPNHEVNQTLKFVHTKQPENNAPLKKNNSQNQETIDEAHLPLMLLMLQQGLSPMTFCKKYDYSIQAYLKTREINPEFDLAVRQAQHSLSDNVASRLYLVAMEGNVSAMSSWLKFRPPLDWQMEEPLLNNIQALENMSDAELVDHARLRGVEIPLELAEIID